MEFLFAVFIADKLATPLIKGLMGMPDVLAELYADVTGCDDTSDRAGSKEEEEEQTSYCSTEDEWAYAEDIDMGAMAEGGETLSDKLESSARRLSVATLHATDEASPWVLDAPASPGDHGRNVPPKLSPFIEPSGKLTIPVMTDGAANDGLPKWVVDVPGAPLDAYVVPRPMLKNIYTHEGVGCLSMEIGRFTVLKRGSNWVLKAPGYKDDGKVVPPGLVEYVRLVGILRFDVMGWSGNWIVDAPECEDRVLVPDGFVSFIRLDSRLGRLPLEIGTFDVWRAGWRSGSNPSELSPSDVGVAWQRHYDLWGTLQILVQFQSLDARTLDGKTPSHYASKVYTSGLEKWVVEHFSGQEGVPRDGRKAFTSWMILKELESGHRHVLFGPGVAVKADKTTNEYIFDLARSTLQCRAEEREDFGCTEEQSGTFVELLHAYRGTFVSASGHSQGGSLAVAFADLLGVPTVASANTWIPTLAMPSLSTKPEIMCLLDSCAATSEITVDNFCNFSCFNAPASEVQLHPVRLLGLSNQVLELRGQRCVPAADDSQHNFSAYREAFRNWRKGHMGGGVWDFGGVGEQVR